MTGRETDAPGGERGSLQCGEATRGSDGRKGGLGTALRRLQTAEAGTPLPRSPAPKHGGPAVRPGRILDGLGTGLSVAWDLGTVLALSTAFALKGRLTRGSLLLVQRSELLKTHSGSEEPHLLRLSEAWGGGSGICTPTNAM